MPNTVFHSHTNKKSNFLYSSLLFFVFYFASIYLVQTCNLSAILFFVYIFAFGPLCVLKSAYLNISSKSHDHFSSCSVWIVVLCSSTQIVWIVSAVWDPQRSTESKDPIFWTKLVSPRQEMQGPVFPTLSLLTSCIHGNVHQLTHLESKEREVLKDAVAYEREQDQTFVEHWGNGGGRGFGGKHEFT